MGGIWGEHFVSLYPYKLIMLWPEVTKGKISIAGMRIISNF
jgi:hypothetical protein